MSDFLYTLFLSRDPKFVKKVAMRLLKIAYLMHTDNKMVKQEPTEGMLKSHHGINEILVLMEANDYRLEGPLIHVYHYLFIFGMMYVDEFRAFVRSKTHPSKCWKIDAWLAYTRSLHTIFIEGKKNHIEYVEDRSKDTPMLPTVSYFIWKARGAYYAGFDSGHRFENAARGTK